MKITSDESLKNFLWDIFIRSFDCRNDLYEDTSVLDENEKTKLLQAYFKDINIWGKIYNKRISFIKENIRLINNNEVLVVEGVVFHPKAGWVISNGDIRAFLGKVSYNLDVKVNIGNYTYFSGPGIIRGKGQLQIGSYCCVAEGCYISVASDRHFIDCTSLYGFFNEGNFRIHHLKFDVPKNYTDYGKGRRSDVTIGNDVWIGRNVRIFNDVNIADGCVIAERSLVKKDCEPYGIYGGVPAKLIKYRFSKNIIEQLLKIQWWNWPLAKIRRNAKFFAKDLTKFDGCLSSIIADGG
ncbi:MAG: CatB-related O-acetyltransferase [Phycisphaerae bacterium]|nr:CatB-related O-acetyltransferase [Phycisphaerae bacterium]